MRSHSLGHRRTWPRDEFAVAPIVMGHSCGGAFVQLLLDAGYGTAGVSIDGAGVKGIKALPFSEISATFPVLHNPANENKAVRRITNRQTRGERSAGGVDVGSQRFALRLAVLARDARACKVWTELFERK